MGPAAVLREPWFFLWNETSGSAVLGKPQHETASFLRLGLGKQES
jgi:hypothetical protein